MFEVTNTIANQPVRSIDPAAEDDAEPALDDLFLEWRTSTARGSQGPP